VTGGARRRVLVVTEEVIAPAMAGPGIRALRIAQFLAQAHDVTLYSFARMGLAPMGVRVVQPDVPVADLVAVSDVVICQGGGVLSWVPRLREEDGPVLVADLYDPVLLEQLEQRRVIGAGVDFAAEQTPVRMLNDYLTTADFVLCATERQRAYWVGHMASLGVVTQDRINADPGLSRTVVTVPFGIDEAPPSQERAIKGVVEGIGLEDRVVLWGGGIHDWFDPIVAVEAMALLAERRPSAKLFFMGVQHPNPNVPPMPIVERTRARADELGVLGRSVFFNDGWVEHARRGAYFADADCAISTHHVSLEAEFSFRTRMLDYLWAGLPIVCTTGDIFAELVDAHGAGVTVPADDAGALADALERMLFDDSAHAAAVEASAGLADRFAWNAVLQPLSDVVAGGAPDRAFRSRSLRLADHDEFASSSSRLETAEAALAAARAEVAELRASTSWRVTAPLRALTGLLAMRRR
jgi:glycosyltransferase involved in cell wall biosynthesis